MTVAIIGAGVMGETLLSGLLRGGHDAADLMVGEKRHERAAELREKYAVRVVADLAEVAGADTWRWSSSRRTWATCSPSSRPTCTPDSC